MEVATAAYTSWADETLALSSRIFTPPSRFAAPCFRTPPPGVFPAAGGEEDPGRDGAVATAVSSSNVMERSL